MSVRVPIGLSIDATIGDLLASSFQVPILLIPSFCSGIVMSGTDKAHEAGPQARTSLQSLSSARSSTTATPLGTGLPTQEELLVYYPAKFTWKQLKTFVNSGDLGLLKRDKKLQIRYNLWAE